MWTLTAGCNSTSPTSITGRCGSISRSSCAPFPSFFPDAVHTRALPKLVCAGKAGISQGRDNCAVPEGTHKFFTLYPGLTPWANIVSPLRGFDFAQSFHCSNSERVLTHTCSEGPHYQWSPS